MSEYPDFCPNCHSSNLSNRVKASFDFENQTQSLFLCVHCIDCDHDFHMVDFSEVTK